MKTAAFKASTALAFVLSAGQAVANYEACMKFCIGEHGFSHCNAVCSGKESSKEVKDSEGKKANGEEDKDSALETIEVEACDALDDKGAAIYYLIKERLGHYPLMAYSETDKADQLSVEFYLPDGQGCEGIATFSGNCDLTLEYQCGSPKRD